MKNWYITHQLLYIIFILYQVVILLWFYNVTFSYFQERLNAETGQKSLVDIVQSMHAKLSAWDVSQIDQAF